MFPDQFVRKSGVADEQHASRGDQQISSRRLLWRYRVCILPILTLFGLHLLAAGSGVGKGVTLSAQLASPGHASVQTSLAAKPGMTPASDGAGASSSERMGNRPGGVCLNPLDVTCWLQNAAQWVAQQITSALQPVINAILKSPLNIITQTPPADTYQNPTVLTWCSAFLTVVDLALASLIVIGGYNVIVGRELGLPHAGLAEFLPRLLLAFGAAHFSLYFLGLFIDLENALCSVATTLAGTSMLTNLIAGIFQGNLPGEGLLAWVLAFVLGVLVRCALLAARLADARGDTGDRSSCQRGPGGNGPGRPGDPGLPGTVSSAGSNAQTLVGSAHGDRSSPATSSRVNGRRKTLR